MRDFRGASVVFIVMIMGSALCACARPPGDGDALFVQGVVAEEAGDMASATEYYEEACAANHFKGCNYLGVITEEEDIKKAARLYQKSCEGGYAAACRNLGNMYYAGEGVEQNPGQAARLYAKACDGGSWNGCAYLGMLHETGDGVEKSIEKANALHEKAFTYSLQACATENNEKEDSNSCYNLMGKNYENENNDEVKQDYTKAARFYEKSCNNGNSEGCNHLRLLYEAGNGVEKNIKTAAALHEKTFAQSERSCADKADVSRCYNELGARYEEGETFKQDSTKAARLYEKSCARENSEGCIRLAMLYEAGHGGASGRKKARALREKTFLRHMQACEEKGRETCYELAHEYEYSRYNDNSGRMATLYEKACDKGSGDGCEQLGSLYKSGNGVRKNEKQAKELYARATGHYEKDCAANDGQGCLSLGWVYELGEWVQKDSAKAFLYYKKGCENRVGDSCERAGLFHLEGRGGIKKDKAAAVAYFTAGCKLKSEGACYGLISTDDEYTEYLKGIQEAIKETVRDLKQKRGEEGKTPAETPASGPDSSSP
ncbi:MAG: sel1 repeat family protein [Zoogloeaceae bacterium]|jgi:TPR repeat protein|nr:sel1 repeat family protein [Zoogloeaceae bacterium]